ncbi:MAG: PilZ domain-containing protein [Bdellovibrionales bacterium]|nr:PilZ domain-containing protein [Bdellovibrionales bacterium]
MAKNNIINLAERRKASRTPKTSNLKAKKQKPSQQEIVDITEMRQEIITQERRQVKRTILTEFVGAFAVVPNHGLVRVAIYDISKDGISFHMEEGQGGFQLGEEVALRVYLNQSTYFPFVARIQNVRVIDEESVTRHGGAFEKDTINVEALHHFVRFIETVSASLERDSGDIMVSNLR